MRLQFWFVIFCQNDIVKKVAFKMLVKLTTGVNFINILCARFLYKVLCTTFMRLQCWFVIFCRKEIGAKAACKMLVNLTPGVPSDLWCWTRTRRSK